MDLPRNQKSGLYKALNILGDLDGIAKLFLTADDVVRHRLVKDIITRYDEADNKIRAMKEGRDADAKSDEE